MRYRFHEIKVPLDHAESEIAEAVARKLQIPREELREVVLIRRSVDARKVPVFSCTVEFTLNYRYKNAGKKGLIEVDQEKERFKIPQNGGERGEKIAVVGAGPAGLMAAYILALGGKRPILFERGGNVASRAAKVSEFWKHGNLDKENNVLYGEGGAGLFSDGKLTSRSKDRPAIRFFLETLIKCGADPSIAIDAEPHLGSDRLKKIVPNLRKLITDAGGEIRFNTAVEEFYTEKSAITGIKVNGSREPFKKVIIATGHSARDVYKNLLKAGVFLEPKAFAVGVRVELSQRMVDFTQYGPAAGHPRLEAASFRLTRKGSGKIRNCYTFCMCPGGTVIPCASEPEMFTTNGMSMSSRALPLANAAFLIPVSPNDYIGFAEREEKALAGCKFQEEIEKRIFQIGGGDYAIPATNLAAFIKGEGQLLPGNVTSFKRVRENNLQKIFPDFIEESLIFNIPLMLRVFKDLSPEDVVVYGAETRSSSPVRITRNDDGSSVSVKGVFPVGEGAGYAGGIVSSALDGMNTAVKILSSK